MILVYPKKRDPEKMKWQMEKLIAAFWGAAEDHVLGKQPIAAGGGADGKMDASANSNKGDTK